MELTRSGQDLGSSSVFRERLASKQPMGAITASGVTLEQLFEEYGVPEYLKVDIEGADRLCVLALTPAARPACLSWEASDDVEELLAHAASVGYTRFKLINQSSFRELSRHWRPYDRVAHWIMRLMGYGPSRLVRRGRFFVADHSSGPVAWRSDGRWWSLGQTLSRLRAARAEGRFAGCYDVHAAVG